MRKVERRPRHGQRRHGPCAPQRRGIVLPSRDGKHAKAITSRHEDSAAAHRHRAIARPVAGSEVTLPGERAGRRIEREHAYALQSRCRRPYEEHRAKSIHRRDLTWWGRRRHPGQCGARGQIQLHERGHGRHARLATVLARDVDNKECARARGERHDAPGDRRCEPHVSRAVSEHVREVDLCRAAHGREAPAGVVATRAIGFDGMHRPSDDRHGRRGRCARAGQEVKQGAERVRRRRHMREPAADVERIALAHRRLHGAIDQPRHFQQRCRVCGGATRKPQCWPGHRRQRESKEGTSSDE